MATIDFKLHDHAGIRWLAPMLGILAIVVAVMLMMMLYPYVSG